MSERYGARCALALGALLALAWPRPARTQSLEEVYRARRDVLYHRYVAQRDSISALVARGRERDNIPVARGRFTVLTSASATDTTAQALGIADSLIRAFLVPRTPDEHPTYRLHPDWAARRADSARKLTWYLDFIEGPGTEPVRGHFSGVPTVAELANELNKTERTRLQSRAPQRLTHWLRTSLPDTTAHDIWETTYVDFVTSPTFIAHNCLAGDDAACRRSLMIDSTADPLTEWFTPDVRRRMALQLRDDVNEATKKMVRDTMPAEAAACFTEGRDAACTALVRRFGANWIVDPVRGNASRQALVLAAVQYQRAPGFGAVLDHHKLSPAEALASVSGATFTDVLREWRRNVMAAQPETAAQPPLRIMTSLAWLFLFGAVSLKGSRWR